MENILIDKQKKIRLVFTITFDFMLDGLLIDLVFSGLGPAQSGSQDSIVPMKATTGIKECGLYPILS